MVFVPQEDTAVAGRCVLFSIFGAPFYYCFDLYPTSAAFFVGAFHVFNDFV
jgi:hypothetical protein